MAIDNVNWKANTKLFFFCLKYTSVYFDYNITAFVVVIVWVLDLQLPEQSVPITTNVVRLNPTHGEVYSIQHYVIKFVSDLWQVGGFLRVLMIFSTNKTDRHDITEILLKVVLNTITLTLNWKCNFCFFIRKCIKMEINVMFLKICRVNCDFMLTNLQIWYSYLLHLFLNHLTFNVL